MDLGIVTETLTADRDYSWLANKHGLDATSNATIAIAGGTKATHYPQGYFKPGLLLAKYTSGGNLGLWAPYVSDGTLGLNVLEGIVFSGFDVRTDADGAVIGTKTSGAIIRKGTPIHVYLSKLPGLLVAAGTAYTPTLANLATLGFVAEDL